ncbi:uncharacterized protein V1518DRAFT_5908 [Limtongia smithiae]|uniref:uncharacterized protein n=1 Tax=Limtongia smithiae TaxID=1125753 RepID=UPI0034CF3011
MSRPPSPTKSYASHRSVAVDRQTRSPPERGRSRTSRGSRTPSPAPVKNGNTYAVSPRDRSRSVARSRSRSPTRSRSRSYDSRSSRSYSRSYSSRSRSRTPSGDDRSRSRTRSRSYDSRSRSRSRTPLSKNQWRRSSYSRSPPARRRSPELIVVENLTKIVTEAHIREIFQAYGRITYVQLPRQPAFGNRNTCYLEYDFDDDARSAIKHMNGGYIDGVQVVVKDAPPGQRSQPPLSSRRPSASRSRDFDRGGIRSATDNGTGGHSRRRPVDSYVPPPRINDRRRSRSPLPQQMSSVSHRDRQVPTHIPSSSAYRDGGVRYSSSSRAQSDRFRGNDDRRDDRRWSRY